MYLQCLSLMGLRCNHFAHGALALGPPGRGNLKAGPQPARPSTFYYIIAACSRPVNVNVVRRIPMARHTPMPQRTPAAPASPRCPAVTCGPTPP
jgi:hypothetical protein